MNDIQFGVQLGTFAGETDTPCYEKVDYNTLKHITLESEKLGYNSVWAADHLILGKDNATLECWTTLTALAAVTKTIRIGSLVLCNSYRYPSILGKMSSTLDLISNGRLDLGIGAGWLKKEYDAYGIPWNKYHLRFEQMREGIEVLKKLWTEECATYIGKHYQLKDAFCEPKPVQKPHPPIWIGGQEEKVMLRLVAELADGWNLTGTPSVEKYREKLNVLKKHSLDIGRPVESIAKS